MSEQDHIELTWIKRIMIGFVTVLCTNLLAGVWWAATMTANMKFIQVEVTSLSNQIRETTIDRYRGSDASKDFAVVNARIERNESRLLRLEEKQTKI